MGDQLSSSVLLGMKWLVSRGFLLLRWTGRLSILVSNGAARGGQTKKGVVKNEAAWMELHVCDPRQGR